MTRRSRQNHSPAFKAKVALAAIAVEPRRWKIEQTFGCLQRYRRLLVDHEGSTAMSQSMTLLAALFMTGVRFEAFSARL